MSFSQANEPDSLFAEIPPPARKKDFVLETKITRTAKDSIKVDYAQRKAFLYGKAKVEYDNIILEADYIEIDFASNTVYACGLPDSSGKIAGNPVFKEGADSYETTEIRYNFTTRKGMVYNVTRQEGDAYVFLEQGKKQPDNVTYVKTGHFTTCSLPHPHYSIRYGKGKIIPNDKIVTGPIYMEIEDIPLPLILPFGFFPNKRGRANGILIPSYGYTENRGYFLSNGGYYTGLGEHMDLAIRGDIYTRLSWAVRALSNYNFRYKASGSFSMEYANNKIGETDTENHTESSTFWVRWNHRQDAKSNPYSSFSANVSVGSTQHNKLNSYNPTDYLSNTFQSSVAYSTRIGNNNLSINLNHNQNSNTHLMTIDFPNINFGTPRINPFQRKVMVGESKWYEKINLTYTMDAKNSISVADSMFTKIQFDDFINGIQHRVPIGLSIPVGYFNWNNNISYTENWYFSSVRKRYDANVIINGTDTGGVITDRIPGFASGRDISFSTGLSTRIYGMFGLKYGPVKAIRHVLTPTLTFSYRPNTGEIFHFYREYIDGAGDTIRYSILEGGSYGSPADGKSGSISLNFGNTLEAKLKSKSDTITGVKKIRILESFNVSTSYDLAKKEFKLAPLSVSARTTLFKQIGVQFTGSWNFYAFDTIQKKFINEYNWVVNKKLFNRNSYNFNFSFNYSLSANTFNNKKNTKPAYQSKAGSEEELRQLNASADRYVDFNNPWSLNLSYSFVYTDAFNTSQNQYIKTTVMTLNFSGDINLTEKWKIGFTSGYDFENKDVSYTTLDIYRDLHCWELMFNWIPIGPRQSYNLTVRVKSPLLQDLKLTKKRDWQDLLY